MTKFITVPLLELIIISMVVYRAVFHSLIAMDKSSFTITSTNSADPVGLLKSVVNDVVHSALFRRELDGVGRWRHV